MNFTQRGVEGEDWGYINVSVIRTLVAELATGL